ncbi:hypothetical protein ACTJJ7_15610 [Phyllobacterium sp. 22229]|uniref:hypothetical protein n=1 Tax=Phyllobacterium sp. 22229 TaxID=3453895 RepID=UPI003F84631F
MTDAPGFQLNDAQKAQLQQLTNGGNADFYKGYDYLHGLITTYINDPANAGAADFKQATDQEFWLRKATEINSNDPGSLANYFIRDITRMGLTFDGKPVDAEKIQANSDIIGKAVIGDAISNGRIPPVTDIIPRDALGAINQGGQTLAGWGGAFNYWNTILDPKISNETVGDRILANAAEMEKFVALNAKALADTTAKFGGDPIENYEALKRGLNAQVPSHIKDQIIARALDGITGQNGGFAGNPENIDGYHPRYDNNGKVVGWYELDSNLKQKDVTNPAKISELNSRHEVRQDKGEFHAWQGPEVKTGTQTFKIDDKTTVTRTYQDGVLTARSTIINGSSRVDETFNPITGKSSSTSQFDGQGRKYKETQFNADGSRVENYYDTSNTQPWKQAEQRFGSDGKLSYQQNTNRDGSRIEWTYSPQSGQATWERNIAADGSRVERNLDPDNKQTWSEGIYHYDAQNGLTHSIEKNHDGTRWERNFDPHNQYPWKQGTYQYNATNQLVHSTEVSDDNSYVDRIFYPDTGKPRIVDSYNSQGQRVHYSEINPDSSRTDYSVEPATGRNLTADQFNANNQLTSQSQFNADGSRIDTHLDPTNAAAWASGVYYYNPNGQLTNRDVTMDDGSRIHSDYNTTDAGGWKTGTYYYNPQGQLTNTDVVTIDGSRIHTDLDPTNAAPWARGEYIFNPNGQLTSGKVTMDDGSRSEQTFNPETGAITQQQNFDGNGNLTYDRNAEIAAADARRLVETAIAQEKARALERRVETLNPGDGWYKTIVNTFDGNNRLSHQEILYEGSNQIRSTTDIDLSGSQPWHAQIKFFTKDATASYLDYTINDNRTSRVTLYPNTKNAETADFDAQGKLTGQSAPKLDTYHMFMHPLPYSLPFKVENTRYRVGPGFNPGDGMTQDAPVGGVDPILPPPGTGIDGIPSSNPFGTKYSTGTFTLPPPGGWGSFSGDPALTLPTINWVSSVAPGSTNKDLFKYLPQAVTPAGTSVTYVGVTLQNTIPVYRDANGNIFILKSGTGGIGSPKPGEKIGDGTIVPLPGGFEFPNAGQGIKYLGPMTTNDQKFLLYENAQGNIMGVRAPGLQITINPVLLDLNGDNQLDVRPIDLTKPNDVSGPHFDWQGNGKPQQTAWVGPKDGLLVIDLAKDGTSGPDGKIDQAKEIAFSLWKSEDERQLELKRQGIGDNGHIVTDLEGLQYAFDTNHDGVLDKQDARWKEFRVWQDLNQDGITDAGELKSLDDWGIKSINLMPTADGQKQFDDGSAITGTSFMEMIDGTKRLVGDATLSYQPPLLTGNHHVSS